jgi:CBS domain-containing protein
VEGSRLAILLETVMSPRVVMILERIPMSEVRTITRQYDYNGFPVVNTEGRLVGMITKGDLLRAIRAGVANPAVWQEPVTKWMAKGVLALRPRETVDDAISAMIESGLRSLPVIDEEGRVVGVVSRNDLIAAIDGRLRA